MVGILTGLPEGWISLSLFVGDAVMKRILSHSDIQVGELEPADGLVHVVDRTGDDLGIQRVVQALQELRLDGRLDHSAQAGCIPSWRAISDTCRPFRPPRSGYRNLLYRIEDGQHDQRSGRYRECLHLQIRRARHHRAPFPQ